MVSSSGALIAQVMAVKGLAGPAEAAGGSALSGADGEALEKALTALGWPDGQRFYTLSRPEPGAEAEARAARLRMQIEAVDPATVIALDAQAAEDLSVAYRVDVLRPGRMITARGRALVAVDGFEASLADGRAKRRVWEQLKRATPPGPVL